MRLLSKDDRHQVAVLEIEEEFDEEEDEPLVVRNGKELPASDKQPPNSFRMQMAVFTLLCLTLVLLFWTTRVAEIEKDETPEDTTKKVVPPSHKHISSDASLFCKQICKKRRDARIDHYGGDILSIHETIAIFNAAKRNFVENLQSGYGIGTYQGLFENKNNNYSTQGCFYFGDKGRGVSMAAALRKLEIKVLESQQGILEGDKNVEGCDCVDGDAPLDPNRKGFNATGEFLEVDKRYSRFLWVTGGHSASAGHGNLYNESYTSFMETAAKGVFGALGIDLEARNFAMGGTGSAFEISMCSAQIFGNDMDAISWDYGMTDGHESYKLLHYFYRAALSSTNPLMFGIGLGHDRGPSMEALAELGLPTIPNSEECFSGMLKEIPDSAVLRDDEVASLPPLVRNFKCGTGIEKGDPHCGDEKYTSYICDNRKGKVSWHPGWKHHALQGNRIAVLLVGLLGKSLEKLQEDLKTAASPADLLAKLKAEEDQVYRDFLNKPVLERRNLEIPADIPEFNYEWFYKGQNMCRTGRLPAMSRFEGFMSESGKVGYIAVEGQEEFDLGIPIHQAIMTNSGGKIRLVQEGREPGCPVVLSPDYKDFFFVGKGEDWQSLVLPNDAERTAYGYDPSKTKGYVFVCPATCDWGKCPAQDVRIERPETGSIDIEVNGSPVIGFHEFMDCLMLKGKDGWTFPNNREDGSFEIRARITNSTLDVGYFRFGSIVVY